MQFHIDSTAIAGHAQTLRDLSKSAFPVVVRQTLNSAAFDVKKNTMPKEAGRFIQRNKTFFKSTSKVEQATGFDIGTMRATVGFIPGKGEKESGGATKDLQDQESGGEIGGRSFIPTKNARVAGGWNRPVKGGNRLKEILKHTFIDAHKTKVMVRNYNPKRRQDFIRKRNPKQQFIRAAFKAKELHGDNAFVLGNKFSGGSRTLSRIDSITSDHKKIRITRTPLYTFKPNREVRVARTNFMRRASLESGLKMDKTFVDAAIKQLKKYSKSFK